MKKSFTLLESNKVGLEGKEHYVIVQGQTVFLRILGGEPEWSLMTATASEDHRHLLVCHDQHRLIESALRLGAELNTFPIVDRDWKGRRYAKICTITREPGVTDEVFTKENDRVLNRFFEIFDSLPKKIKRTRIGRRNLYDELGLGHDGEDIYLSDGVSISRNGKLTDLGN